MLSLRSDVGGCEGGEKKGAFGVEIDFMNLASLMEDPELMNLLQAQALATPPSLAGKYGVELPESSSPRT